MDERCVALRCNYCWRLIRELVVDLDSGTLRVHGTTTREGYKPTGRRIAFGGPWVGGVGETPPPKMQSAECYDASPGGRWGDRPTRYRFVCRGPRHRLGRVLDRTVPADRLLELCRDALTTPGPPEIAL